MAKTTVTKAEVRQDINLREIYNRTPTNPEKDRFISLAIERIIERSQRGRDVDGNRFRAYSPEYAEQKGVGRTDVDMTLFGDMLLAIEGEQSRDKVRIKIDDPEEAIKAFAHITGFRGHPHIDGPVRNFFGLNDNEIERIARRAKDSTVEEADDALETVLAIIENLRIEAEESGEG